MFNNISIIKDKSSHSTSIMTTIKIKEYLELVNGTNQLDSQRDVLKTKSAITIRKRLIKDLENGTIIPPIVLGVIIPESQEFEADIENLILSHKESLTIIDGIQRTESLRKAVQNNEIVNDNEIRVEFWASHQVSNLIYRMLVLNTGQVPWNTRRQVEVVYNPLKIEAENKVNGLKLITIQENGRRSNPGEFSANVIADFYLAFTSRKELFESREGLVDEFTRLDVIDMTSKLYANNAFFDTLQMLVDLDQIFFRFNPNEETAGKIKRGQDLFTSSTSRIGFIVAIAKALFGRPGGRERTEQEIIGKAELLKTNFDNLKNRLNGYSKEQMRDFLAFEVLNELLQNLPKKKVGDEERIFFTKAYDLFVRDNFETDSLEEAWRN